MKIAPILLILLFISGCGDTEKNQSSLILTHQLPADVQKITGTVNGILFSTENSIEITASDRLQFDQLQLTLRSGYQQNLNSDSLTVDQTDQKNNTIRWDRSIGYQNNRYHFQPVIEITPADSGHTLTLDAVQGDERYFLYPESFNTSSEQRYQTNHGITPFFNASYRAKSTFVNQEFKAIFSGIKPGNYQLLRYSRGRDQLVKVDTISITDHDITLTENRPGVFLYRNQNQLLINYNGELVDHNNLTLHYGYNGWNSVDLTGFEMVDNKNDLIYHKEEPLTKNGHYFQKILQIPEGGAAIHFVFYSEINGDKMWDNNHQKDYHSGITFPYIGPYLQIKPGHNIETTMFITYHTDTPSPTIIEYGETEQLNQRFIAYKPAEKHEVVLDDLKKDQFYHYRVCDYRHICSKTYRFKTGNRNKTSLKFIALGDAQDNGDDRRLSDVVDTILTHHNDIDLILFAGDMVWDDFEHNWWIFFHKGRELFATKPLIPVIGNHDTPTVNSSPEWSSGDLLCGISPHTM